MIGFNILEKNPSALLRTLELMTVNSYYNKIPDDLFEVFFIDMLLNDKFIKLLKENKYNAGTTKRLYKIFRYNLIFKQNIEEYASKSVIKSMASKGSEEKFRSAHLKELKRILDKVYEAERITKYNLQYN